LLNRNQWLNNFFTVVRVSHPPPLLQLFAILGIGAASRVALPFPKLGTGCSKDGLEQDAPATMKKTPLQSVHQ
jgi:hypothetical protein